MGPPGPAGRLRRWGALSWGVGGEKEGSSTLDDGVMAYVAATASREGSSPDMAGKDSEAVETPALEAGGTTAYRYRCALGCGGILKFPARPGKLASDIWPRRVCSQCAGSQRVGQCECLGCGQPPFLLQMHWGRSKTHH